MARIIKQRKGESLRGFYTRATMEAGLHTGNRPLEQFGSPAQGNGDWNPHHKNIGPVRHPEPNTEIPRATSNPYFKPLPKKAKIARAINVPSWY